VRASCSCESKRAGITPARRLAMRLSRHAARFVGSAGAAAIVTLDTDGAKCRCDPSRSRL
jgi:hypothetical protein